MNADGLDRRRAEERFESGAPAALTADAAVPTGDGALARAAARFGRVFESHIVGVIVADLEGGISEANDCFLDMVGYERADLPLRWDAMTPPEWHAIDEGKIRELLSTNEAQNWDKEYFHTSGEKVPITVCAMLLEGKQDECIAVILDRTEKRKMEDARRWSDERYQRRLRALALEVSLTAERERRRIAVGLHDQIGQALAMVRMKLDLLRRPDTDPTAAATLDEVTDMLAKTVEATRDLTFALSPPMLYELGLDAALRSLAKRVRRHGISCRFETDELSRPLPTDSAIVAHQVVRELLFNVLKHAQAADATMSVATAGDRMRIEVVDDGVGFEMEDEDAPFDSDSGFGLFSARERLAQIGGTLEIETAPQQGTRAVLTVPLSAPREDTA